MDEELTFELHPTEDSHILEDCMKISNYLENKECSANHATSIFLNLLGMNLVDKEDPEEEIQFYARALREIYKANKNSS